MRQAVASVPDLAEWQNPTYLAGKGWPTFHDAIEALLNREPVANEAPDLDDKRRAALDWLGERWLLHPVQAAGSDAVVKAARADDGVLAVPGRTAAVFVRPRAL